jgi:hypothetical protein
MTQDQLLFWFGFHYDHLDHGFRSKQWADRIAVIAFVPGSEAMLRNNAGNISTQIHTACVYYDTATMTYVKIEYMGRITDLKDWKI